MERLQAIPSPDPYIGFSSAPMEIGREDETEVPLSPRSYTVGPLTPRDLWHIPPLNSGPAFRLNAARFQADGEHGLVRDDSIINTKKRLLDPFRVESTDCSQQGIRPSMEDRHLVESGKLGTLILVCDGHGLIDKKRLRSGEPQDGLKMATQVVNSAKEHLLERFRSNNFHFQSACEKWAEMTHNSLPKNVIAGTTAAVALIERVNGILSVGNIGDSKIVVFREHKGAVYAIPMSPIKNWDTPECVEKVRQILTQEEFGKWVQLQGKERRFGGLNLCCSLGDHQAKEHGQSALSHLPVCSQLQLRPGDRILCACDGLFDFASIQELQDLFAQHWRDEAADFAKIAVDYALRVKKSTDNVTAVVATMIEGKEPEIQRTQTEPIDYDSFE
ncbi:MAG: protein phosphatase 2C family protein [Verrucomicrobia bacterium]|nr:protein phosphatase 2C family protein [Verrucomicrobiota bacterium]